MSCMDKHNVKIYSSVMLDIKYSVLYKGTRLSRVTYIFHSSIVPGREFVLGI